MRRTALWLAMAALTVAVSAALPPAALWIQDSRLEGTVQTQLVETIDLSLLSDLDSPGILRLARESASRVALEQGRALTAAQAEQTAIKTLHGLMDMFGGGFTVTDQSASPWLYVGPEGESAVFWQVELSFQGQDIFTGALYGMTEMLPASASLVVDDRTGALAQLEMIWQQQPAVAMEQDGEAALAQYPEDPLSSVQSDLQFTLGNYLLGQMELYADRIDVSGLFTIGSEQVAARVEPYYVSFNQ